jgi:hypothetical protein
MKLCLMILSVPWYMFNGLEYTAILSHFLTFITGSSSRLLHIRFSADLTMYWFLVCHFRCKEFNPLVIWIWNQNIAISTIVGTSSHIINIDTPTWPGHFQQIQMYPNTLNIHMVCVTYIQQIYFFQHSFSYFIYLS